MSVGAVTGIPLMLTDYFISYPTLDDSYIKGYLLWAVPWNVTSSIWDSLTIFDGWFRHNYIHSFLIISSTIIFCYVCAILYLLGVTYINALNFDVPLRIALLWGVSPPSPPSFLIVSFYRSNLEIFHLSLPHFYFCLLNKTFFINFVLLNFFLKIER